MDMWVRPLRVVDISRVAEIERQAFPTLRPPTPFLRDLEGRQIKYLVAGEPKTVEPLEGQPEQPSGPVKGSRWARVLVAVRERFRFHQAGVQLDYNILGFLGLWLIAGEAHITAIAVEESARGRGIGELLLRSSIELALSLGARAVTLEARVSNHVAESLYVKYDFQKVGLRKGYYTDNREDAMIMSTEPIETPAFKAKFRALGEAYKERYGEMTIELV